jgi:hypothetical protein
VLRTGELFVMNPAAPDSFDGRYFGVLRMARCDRPRDARFGPMKRAMATMSGSPIPRHRDFPQPPNPRRLTHAYWNIFAADGGYAGHLHTLTLDIDLVLVRQTRRTARTAPDYRDNRRRG